MKSIIYLLLSVILSINLLAVDLKLPDEIITGNVNLPPDSIEIHKDLTNFQTTQKEELFKYNPVLKDSLIQRLHEQPAKNGFLQAYLGNHYLNGFNIIYQNHDKKLLNSHLNYDHCSLTNKWTSNKFNLLWDAYDPYKPILTSTTLEVITDQYKLNDTKNNFFFFDIKSHLNLSQWVKYIQSISLSTSFGSYSYKTSSNTISNENINDLDLIVETKIDLPKYIKNNDLKLNILKKHLNLHYSTETSQYTRFVDESAIQLLYSKYFIPSVSFIKTYRPEDDIIIALNNNPINSLFHRFNLIQLNPKAVINNWKYQTQAPLNAELSFNWYTLLPVHATYSSAYLVNYPLFIESTNGDYLVKGCNAFKQKISVSTDLTYHDVDINASTSFNFSNTNENVVKIIPFLPLMENNFLFLYQYFNIDHSLEFQNLIGRKVNSKDKMKDVLLVNYLAEYKWKYQIDFFGKLDNLLNQKTQQFSGYPMSGINLLLGLKWEF